ncbi:hypothetical protein ACFV4M_07010 [Kitasatospora indigofera]|uniref:hypothetical protein n=1 Tax=Kitasatospora indigofera TaxID=67307 RepID=UPI003650A2C7
MSDTQAMTNQELLPLSDELAAEVHALATFLRDLFRGLDVSIRRYAVRKSRDAGSVSRFLNGQRVPHWEFIATLLEDLAEKRGPVQAEVVVRVRALHRAALRASNEGRYELQVLHDQLERADRDHRQAEVREQALLEALQHRQQRIAALEADRLQLEAASYQERQDREQEIEQYEDATKEFTSEITRLRREIAELKTELKAAHDKATAANSKCESLEKKIEEYESIEGARVDPPTAEMEEMSNRLEAALREVDSLKVRTESGPTSTSAPLSENLETIPYVKLNPDVQHFKSIANIELLALLLWRFWMKEDRKRLRPVLESLVVDKPISEIAALCAELSPGVHQELRRTIAIGFASYRDAASVTQLLDLPGAPEDLREIVAAGFILSRGGDEVASLLRLSQGLPCSGFVLTAFGDAGRTMPDSNLADIAIALNDANSSMLDEAMDVVCQSAAHHRSMATTASFIFAMKRSGLDHMLTRTLEAFHDFRPANARRDLRAILGSAGYRLSNADIVPLVPSGETEWGIS